MSVVSGSFVGEHDFSSFCKVAEGKSNTRRVTELTLSTSGDELELVIEANAFCHQMVRSIVGYLYDVGRGYTDPESAYEVIAAILWSGLRQPHLHACYTPSARR